ncbi:MAG: hypothetical protein HC818_01750 [Synechococcaceae cyanobacterium RM1_1_27]|nr:hypothetical protein [Synechococcaceae cyanobacterium SM2_3_2]NJO85551.1 hypothetical protein [Synechococcaceae cyanobacterium RM1_1_27]
MTMRGSVDPIDRLWGSLPYLLPLVSILPLGLPLFTAVPPLLILFRPLLPLYGLLTGFGGFGSLICFMLLFFLVVRNDKLAHFIRFNGMQALLVSIAQFLVQVVLQLVGVLGLNLGLLTQTIGTTLFLGTVVIAIYAWVQNARGHYAEIPVISEAAYTQVRY